MSQLSPLEAYDLVSHARLVRDRLSAAFAGLGKRQGLARERAWLSEAAEVIGAFLDEHRELAERALALPELSAARDEHVRQTQEEWVDSLEKLQAGITFHAGSRAPVLEALFPPKQKLSSLRKAPREAVEKWAAAFDKRLGASYVKRMFAQPSFAFAPPVVEQLCAAFARWRAANSPAAEPASSAEVLAALVTAGGKAERLVGQARLLAQAALLPVEGSYEASGIGARARRRAAPAPSGAEKTRASPPASDGSAPRSASAADGTRAARRASASPPDAPPPPPVGRAKQRGRRTASGQRAQA
ncbi:MAG: hypothetical protein HYZ28_27165 [Myxococcales bacterium]|nr:hypothetical protein [Myxococcales bacterium]